MISIKKKLLGEILIEKGLINKDQLNIALEYQKNNKNKRIGEILVELGYIKEEDVSKALADSLNINYINPIEENIDESLILKLDINTLKNYKILPIKKDESGIIIVGLVDPLDNEAINIARSILGTINIEVCVIPKSSFDKIISELENKFVIEQALKEITTTATYVAEDIINLINIEELQEKTGIIKLVEAIFKQAITYRATDIHIEPLPNNVRVRYRIDGILYKGIEFGYESFNELVSRIKLLASLNITEHRLPQDGHVIIKTRSGDYDLRISTLPSRYGEKVVIRILDKRSTILTLNNLGFNEFNLKNINRIIRRPYGFILVSGPTGGGKTTTLFSLLKELDFYTKNVVTIEDPIEYEIQGITQVQVNEKIGLTFEEGLKHILRQDPDIILIGEIRDKETLHIALQAALTGHLVLATIHANDALSTILRIKEILSFSNINNEQIFSSLIGIINQRLVRVLCNSCKKPISISKEQFQSFISIHDEDIESIHNKHLKNKDNLELYTNQGCPLCNYTGYIGRTLISEVIYIDSFIRELFEKNIDIYNIKKILRKEKNQLFIIDDAIIKILNSITSIDEMNRVI